MIDAAMLFAAGFGTRMGALTQNTPKPLIKVAGRPLIDHAMTFLRDQKVSNIVANAHYHADQIVDYFSGSEVQVSVERPDILNTGGGLKKALPLLGSDIVITMNTDAVWQGPNPIKALQNTWSDDMDVLLLCVPKERAIGHAGNGDFEITGSGKAKWGRDFIYTGAQIIRTKFVSDTPDTVFSLKQIWQDLEPEGRVSAIAYHGNWCDVGHPDGITLAEDMLNTADV